MPETQKSQVDEAQEAVKFLERDFNQCFNQMRHYDMQIVDICKFMFTAYTALVGAAVALYQFSASRNIDLVPAAVIATLVGLILGIFMFSLIIRDRVYFVVVTRYINEHRQLFLRNKPLGFQNVSKMYTNPTQPPFFNWRSSQSWFSYIVAFLNALLFGILIYMVVTTWLHVGRPWLFAAIGWGLLFLIQLVVSIMYLKSRESKSASQAVFGKDGTKIVGGQS